MSSYEVRLVGREEIVAGSMAFHFEKSAGFSFKPGQAIDLILMNPPSAEVATMTEMHNSNLPWQGGTGLIDQDLVISVSKELVAPIYYIAGPPSMVADLRQTLAHVGINDGDVRSEEFYGY